MRAPTLLGLSLLALAACHSPREPEPALGPAVKPPSPTPSAAATPAVKPPSPLVVTIVVDQLAAWVAEERLPLLPKDGGFARLRREGTWFKDMRYAHAPNDTGPGHASLYTGQVPRESGIYGNETFDVDGKRVSTLEDRETKLVSPTGLTDARGSSARPLQVNTVADALRTQHPNATIISISLKDRGAIFGGGRKPTASLWFAPGLSSFVTSTAFVDTFPAWAVPHGSKDAFGSATKRPWDLADSTWIQSRAKTPDEQAGEGDLEGLGTHFPHSIDQAKRPPVAFRATPLADEVTLALAEDAVAASMNGAPMLLAISLSSNDYIGHVFGPDSWEAWEGLRRIDAALGRFFAALDAKVGGANYAVVLAADHGTTNLPEVGSDPAVRPWCQANSPDRWARPCGKVSRISPDDLATSLENAAEKALGKGSWILGIADPYLFLSKAAQALPADKRAVLDAALRSAIQKQPDVAELVDLRKLPATCPPMSDESTSALVCRSVPPGGRDYYLVLKPGSFFDVGYTPGKGMNHGSPYLFDRSVPLLVRAPGRVDPGAVVEAPTRFTAFARAIYALLGLPTPAFLASEPSVVRAP